MTRAAVLASLGLALPVSFLATPQDPQPQPQQDPAISSRVLQTASGERVLVQELRIEAPVAAVWAAYTTADGWRAWASPECEIDLRAGGTIRTHYTPGAEIGSTGTNTLHIVNYVPERLLTLRADLQPNWPEVMKQDAGNLMNVIVFEPLGDDRTRVCSYGCGYGKSPEYETLLQFFLQANDGLHQKLKEHLEG